ncbi:MAG: ABC transporter ATP-binding protein [Chitinispirillaceae bacterium]|nr:ABC transporter ATP-binding protein [Chitinispirillaceae bacterium]
MSSLSLRSLCCSYPGTVPVLSDVSFTVEQGETWAIIGKNGSGKSTLLKCIGGLLKIKSGSISVEGKPVSSYSSMGFARMISYVPQAGNRTLPLFAVADFVMLGRFPYQGFYALPSREDHRIVAQAMQLTDTGRFADRSMDTLSGGEVQRVFLAAAVAQKTGILLLDEPMSFLDPRHQEMISRSLERIHGQYRTTMLTVTHDVNHAINRFSHLCALVDGKAYFCGPVEKFKENILDKLRDVYSISFIETVCYEGATKYYIPGGMAE